MVITRLSGSADQRALVYDGDTLAGIVSPSDVTRVLELTQLGNPATIQAPPGP